MARNPSQRGQHIAQGDNQISRGLHLRLRVGIVISALELDANRKIIAGRAALKCRHPRMPGTIKDADKLNHLTLPADEKVGGDPQTLEIAKRGMACAIKPPQKKILDCIALITPGR